jgi:hypothetical protein
MQYTVTILASDLEPEFVEDLKLEADGLEPKYPVIFLLSLSFLVKTFRIPGMNFTSHIFTDDVLLLSFMEDF